MWRATLGPSATVVSVVPDVPDFEYYTWPQETGRSTGEVVWSVDPADQLGRLPTPLLLHIEQPVRAIATVHLPGGGLTAVWSEHEPSQDAGARLTQSTFALANDFIALSAEHDRAAVEMQFNVVLNGLRQAVVIINASEGNTRLNGEAQSLLKLEPGQCSIGIVAEALNRLQAKAVNASEIIERAAELLVHRDAVIEQWLWRFDDPPMHLSVSTYPLDGAAEGRAWVFQDVSSEQQRLALERASFEYRERFETAMRSSSIGVAILDTDGRYINVNEALCIFLGRTRRELLSKTWRDVVHQSDVTPALLQLRKDVTDGTSEGFRTELRYQRPDGRVVHGALTFIPLHDANDVVQFTMAQIVDITPQVEAQERLTASVEDLYQAREESLQRERLLEATLDSMLDPHIVIEPIRNDHGEIIDYVYRSANAAACAYNNMPHDELIGSRFLELFPTLRNSELVRMYGSVVDTGEPLILDEYHLFNDVYQEQRFYDLRLVPVGQAISYTWRDVTERVNESGAKARLAEERERLIRQLPVGVFKAHATPDGLASLDYLSDRAAELLGVSYEWAAQDFQSIGRAIHPDDLPGLAAAFTRSIRELEELDWQGRASTTSPAEWLSIQGVFESSSDDKVMLEGIIQDISLSKAYETELVEARASAEVAADIKSTFLANMSHEIRTPLTAVLGLLRLLEQSQLEPNQRSYAARAEQAAQDLLEILNDILDFSRIEAGSLLLDPQPANLNAVLSDIGVVMASNLGEKPIELLFDVDPLLPSTVMVDELRLRQVLTNLAGNAIKFTEQGEVQISLRQLIRSDGSVRIRFEITDTGIGMSEDAIAHAFEGFTQADASIARLYGGSGLGLAISHRLVERMGGDLLLTSTLGEGTTLTFSLWLPVVVNEVHEFERLRGLRVLLATERGTAGSLLKRMCDGLNWPVTQTTLADAIEKIEQLRADGEMPDVVLLDVPAGKQLESIALAPIRAALPSSEVSMIVLLSQQARHAMDEAHFASLADACVVKPFTVSTLFDAVANVRLGRVTDVQPEHAAPRRHARSRLSGVRILLAEDNDINRDVVTEMLEREGAAVTGVTNGELAVNAIDENASVPFDVVLMDMQMPHMDGLSATKQIREGLGRTDLPILAMTANAMRSEREACIRAGMNDHISKPFDFDELVQRLQHWSGLTPEAVSPIIRPVEISVLDLDSASTRLDGDVPFLNQMLERFSHRLPTLVSAMCENLDEGKFKDAAATAHSIKGSAATVGADDCAAAASTLEQTLKAGNQPTSGDDTVVEVRAASDRVLQAIRDHLQTAQ